MTKYIYKGKEITHLDFISIMKRAGLNSGWRKSHYEHLCDRAEMGDQRAVEILKDLQVIK